MQIAPLRSEHSAYQGVMQVAYPQGMAYDSPRHVRRRENLRRLLTENGGAAQVALEVGTPKSHFSAILAGRRGIGDDLASKLEKHFEKPTGWMDADQTPSWPFQHIPIERFLSLSAEDRARIEGRLEEAIAGIAAAAPPKPQTVLLSGTKQAKKRKAA